MTDITTEDLRLAREQYDRYVGEGLKMSPPFKGFAIEHIWFAMDEPLLYKALFQNGQRHSSVMEMMEQEGHMPEVLEAIKGTFPLDDRQATGLYMSLWPVLVGITSLITSGTVEFTIAEASAILGAALRANMLALKAGQDERTGFIPSTAGGPEGKVDEYIDKAVHEIGRRNNELMLQTLIGQNRLLKSLHATQRYVRDNEWVELDRLIQGGFGISRRRLAERYAVLTDGDIRLIVLEKLGFSVGACAVLLGISPASVTKTRQRLKAKLQIASVDEFVGDL